MSAPEAETNATGGGARPGRFFGRFELVSYSTRADDSVSSPATAFSPSGVVPANPFSSSLDELETRLIEAMRLQREVCGSEASAFARQQVSSCIHSNA